MAGYSKVVASVLHLLAYAIGLLLLARASNLSDRQKALILACAFFTSIDFVGYRFDDYHVLADGFQVYSLVILLLLPATSQLSRRLRLVAILGALSGLTMMTRLNDGAALCLGVAIALLFLLPATRILSLVLFVATAALTVVTVVHFTGDSLHDWASNSIFHVAANKGGTNHVLLEPLQLPWDTLKYLDNSGILALAIYSLGAIFSWVFLVRPAWQDRQPRSLVKASIGAILIVLPALYFGHYLVDSVPIVVFPPLGVLAAYALGLAIVVRVLCHWLAPAAIPTWNPREILLIIPLGQMMSGSMSSGGSPLGMSGPLAIMILLLPVAFPSRPRRESVRAFAVAVLALLAVGCAAQKYRVPYSWHSYNVSPLFVGRQWYRHPDYGPMIIERDNLAFIQPVCDAVKADGAQQGLLSLPYPYANYFCAIPPWHGYVQTFFDTSTRATIESLMADLQTSPPKWILYQRQLDNMALHERIYNHGNPLPHRDLDRMIEQKIERGDWHVVYTSNYLDQPALHNQWFLIQTR